jgi:FkbM family methyltransferase
MIGRFWQALYTWTALANAFEASRFARRIPLAPRWELLREKFRSHAGQSLRTLPSGFVVRNNRSDVNVVISMPLEYGIIEWNFADRSLAVVDAGANISAFAAYLNSFATIERYIGIEAAPGNYAVLKANVERLGPQFSAVQCVLTNEPKPVMFDLSGTPSQLGASATGEALQGLSLDSIPEVRGLDRVGLLKIDVEGAELELLDGARETLGRTNHVIMEIHHSEIGDDGVARVFEILDRDFDHVVYEQSPDHRQSNAFFRRRTFASVNAARV